MKQPTPAQQETQPETQFEIYLTVEVGEVVTPLTTDLDKAIRTAIAEVAGKHLGAACIKVDSVLNKATEQEIEGDWSGYTEY